MKTCASSDMIQHWEAIDFRIAEARVKKLQMRIAKAQKEGCRAKMLSLQHKLIHSFYAKALAVKIVTTNKGKHTPGVDGVLWTTPEDKWQAISQLNRRGFKPKPLERVYIQKSNGKKRPLSIPTMRDRAMQTLYKMALDPVAEITADQNSYGFRNGRCARDAMIRCTNVLSENQEAVWVLEADIQSCFDNINHDWVMKNVPMDKAVLQKFLKNGYIENQKRYPTERGVPQGGSLSPVICNMVLDGLEKELENRFPSSVYLVRYADDFVVIGDNRDFLKQSVVPLINDFLSERGLKLSPEKTRISHIKDGFCFLGWKVYKEGRTLIITPSEKNVLSLLGKIEDVVKQESHRSPYELYHTLKPIVVGWLNYHRGLVIEYSLYEVEYDVCSLLNRLTEDTALAALISTFFSSE